MSEEKIKIVWRSEYEMEAQCGDRSAVDTLTVTGFSDDTILAEYSPYTGRERQLTFTTKVETVDWISKFLSDDDLQLAPGCDYDFMCDLDEGNTQAPATNEDKSPEHEMVFITDEGARVTLRVLEKYIVASSKGIIVRCERGSIMLKTHGAAFLEMGNAIFNVTENTARDLQIFFGKSLGRIIS